jgi:serine/threonine protein kinase
MHSKNMAHRDLKPENVLLDSTDVTRMNLKITDFGFAKFHDPDKEEGLTDMLGSPLYMAPEIIKKLPYDNKVDIWSIGVILYIMMTGRPPFKGRTKEEIFLAVTS